MAMLKDITIGQHINGNSPVHNFDARLKILALVCYIVTLFFATNAAGLALALAFILTAYAVARIPLKMLFRSLKPILPIIIFTTAINIFFVGGDPVFQFWIITITKQGLFFTAVMASRIIGLIAAASLLTYTTSPIMLTDALERLMKPLELVKLPVNELAMMMTLALRFIPTLLEETEKIMNAQKSRGSDMDTGKFFQRVKALVPILVPLFISAFRRADELAIAMECRCYRGGKGRTRLKQLKLSAQDFLTVFLCAAVFAAVFATRGYFAPLI